MAAFDLDMREMTADDMDEVHVAPGRYVVTLVEQATDNESGAAVLSFRIDRPTFKGAIKKQFLSDPNLAESEEAGKGQRERLVKWCKRLGAITAADAGKIARVDLASCVGKQYVLALEIDPKPDKKTGKVSNFPKIPYLGIWPLDHEEISGPERVALGLPLLAGQAADPATPPAKQTRGKASTAAASAVPTAAKPAAPALHPGEII